MNQISRKYKKSNNMNVVSNLWIYMVILLHIQLLLQTFLTRFLSMLPMKSQKPYHTNKSLLNFMGERIGNSSEICGVISLLKSGKSFGPNSILMKFVKLPFSLISAPLSIILNESFQLGVFPDKLKLAKVIPLFKKDFSDFSKIAEKVM